MSYYTFKNLFYKNIRHCTRMEVSMNNNDISVFINMISKMDKNQLANGINQLNQILSNEDKQRIIQALNNQNKHQ